MNSFDKSRRLLSKVDYQDVFAQAKKVASSEFVVLYRNNSLGQARLGLALSKKNIPKAHDRNRIKRFLRETFRIKRLPPVDVVVLARFGVAGVERKTLMGNIEKLWDKLIS